MITYLFDKMAQWTLAHKYTEIVLFQLVDMFPSFDMG